MSSSESVPDHLPDGDAVHRGNTALDEDLFCLTCGYNLRGLSGDPVRCPECGALNDRAMAEMPAPLIAMALEKMETEPRTCAALSVLVGIGVVLQIEKAAVWGLSPLVGLALLGGAWCVLVSEMKSAWYGQAGWQRVLLDYHLAAWLTTLPVPLYYLAFLVDLGNTGGGFDWSVLQGVLVVSSPFIYWGRMIRRRTREGMIAMQRAQAARIAKKWQERAAAEHLWTIARHGDG